MRYQKHSTQAIQNRIRAFSRYYALLREFTDKGLLKSSLDRGAFTHPRQILRKRERDLLGSHRHRASLGYGPEAGEPILRERIAQLENLKHNTNYTKDNVVLVAGAWCGVELVFEELAQLRGGSFKRLRIASIGPTHYQLFQRPIEMLGAEVEAFDFVNFEGSTPETEQELNDVLACKPDVVFVTNPNNPIGEYFRPELLRSLSDKCADRKIPLVIDEMQNFLPVEDAGLKYGHWIQAPHVIRVDSFSKHFGLAEYRIGWVIAAPEIVGDRYGGVIGRTRGLMGNAPRAANDAILALLGGEIEGLNASKRELPRQWQGLINKEAYIARVLSREPRVTILPREGCFNISIRVTGEESDIALARRLMEAGTLLMPCEGYGFRSEDVVMRITFAERWEKINHGIAALRSVLTTSSKEIAPFSTGPGSGSTEMATSSGN